MGQVADTVPGALRAAIARLDGGSIVRIRPRSGGHVAGPFLRSNAAAIEIGPYIGYAEAPTTVRLAELDSLWTRGTSAPRLMWPGAILGAVVGLGVAGMTTNCDSKFCTANLGLVTVGGGGGGALLGALVGSATPRWQVRFGRPPSLPREWVVADSGMIAVSWLLWRAVSAIPAQAKVRLRMQGGPDIEGSWVGVQELGLVVRPASWSRYEPPPVAPIAGVRALYERRDSKKQLGIVGGLVGFVAGLWVGTGAYCDPGVGGGVNPQCATRLLGTSTVSGAIGTLAGIAIGSLLPRWQQRYP